MGLGQRARRSSSAVGTAARKALQTADTLCSCRMLRCSSMCGNRSGETRISATTREGTKGRTRVVRFAWRDVLSGGVGTRRRGGFLRSGVSVDWPGACTRADLRGSMRSRRLLALRRVSTIARERVGNNEGPEKLSHIFAGPIGNLHMEWPQCSRKEYRAGMARRLALPQHGRLSETVRRVSAPLEGARSLSVELEQILEVGA